ncbi:FecR domain-containing protein [Sphingobium yanoikuyae]|uniref:FecR domain-containing protein n=1 Tax=Sphingobium yanoikuyae TaxID=13690 RepID=A0A9X7UKH3_SPHYA|nr:FecR domain-containing protein [Sphingobium yanoikuyae]
MMTDIGAARAARDNQEAMEWAMLILADHHAVPDPTALDRLGEHQAAFSAWVAADPSREARYLVAVREMLEAGGAAAELRMRSRRLHAPKNKRSFRPFVPLAASLALMLVAGGIWWRSQDDAPRLIAQSEARTPIETRVGEKRTERLSDGTSVLLDTDTLLLVKITATNRNVEIKRGRARFSVAPDAQRPFVVHAAGTTVTSQGGSFDMTLRDGVRVNPIDTPVMIAFTRPIPADQATSLQLRPGQLLKLTTRLATEISVIPAPRSEQQWVTGVKSFDNVPINEVIAEANSYSETKIELATPALGNREIFADIDIRDIERVAQALASFLDATIDRSRPNKLILTEKK